MFILHLVVSYQECPDGEVRVRGINTDGFKAGFIDICDDDDNRRPLCGDGFDANAAIVICAELEFPMAGTITISSHVNMM